jgi:hypothetical protein
MSLKLTGTIATSLLLALSAAAENAPLPQLRIEPTTGGSIFYVKNPSSQALTAYVIELVDYPGSSFGYWQDEIVSEPIAPGAEKRIEVANMTVGAVPDYVKLQAAIYADGSTAGVPGKVEALIARRRFMVTTAQDMIRRMERAVETNTPKDVATGSLRQAAAFMLLPPGADRNSQLALNQAAGRIIINQGIEYLDKHSIKEALDKFHDWEKMLKESKPAL